MTPIDHWLRWVEACALDLCPPETRAALRGFAAARFRHYVERYAYRTATATTEALLVPPVEAWHRFETWLCLRKTRQGKVYKQWLAAHAADRSQASGASLEGAACLLIRDVVREYLRREVAPAFMVSMDAPVAGRRGTTSIPVGELIPDPHPPHPPDVPFDVVAEAAALHDTLTPRERVALLARQMELPLSHPDVTTAAGCGKSTLCVAYTHGLESVAAWVRARLPHEDRQTQADTAVCLFGALGDTLLAWGRSEIRCARFFNRTEGAP